jgi:hypothetical protein
MHTTIFTVYFSPRSLMALLSGSSLLVTSYCYTVNIVVFDNGLYQFTVVRFVLLYQYFDKANCWRSSTAVQ